MADSNITKNALASSLKSLMEQKPFQKINVNDICEGCGMNRKSFYYHFKDKYDLVNWIFYTEFVSHIHVELYDNGWDLLVDVCRYFEAKGTSTAVPWRLRARIPSRIISSKLSDR